MMFCFLKGNILPASEAAVGINDLALLRGYGVFDYLRTYKGRPFRLHDYIERFKASAAALHLPFFYDDEKIANIIDKLLKKSEVTDKAGIRFLLTGGNSLDSMTISEPNFAIIIENFSDAPKEQYEKGVKLLKHDHQRIYPEAKTINYLTAIKMLPLIKEKKAFDLLFCSNGNILELTRNNFFLVKNGKLLTADNDVLFGVTRKVIFELADGKIPVEARKVKVEELAEADEAFLSSSAKKIIPVVQVDDQMIGNGKPGEITQKLMQMFDEYTEKFVREERMKYAAS